MAPLSKSGLKLYVVVALSTVAPCVYFAGFYGGMIWAGLAYFAVCRAHTMGALPAIDDEIHTHEAPHVRR